MSFQERLRSARKKCGLTQQQVAAEIGVTPSTYCGYETGKREPDVEKIKLLASVLHISADSLLDTNAATSHDDTNNEYIRSVTESLQHNPKLGLLFDRSRKMSEKDLDAVLGIVDAILKERDPD